MLLLVDVGNTNMVFGIYKENRITNIFRLTTGEHQTSDEIGIKIWGYFQRFNLDLYQIEDIIICSVVPRVMHTLTNAMIKYLNKRPIVVNEDVQTGLKYTDNSPYAAHHGADRSVACIGALSKYGKPIIVLDFGTASTVDVLDSNGVYQGGAILAGIQISINALFQKTAKLPQVELEIPDKVLEMETVKQIQTGVIRGYIGAVEYLVSESKRELKEPEDNIKVVATGGLSRLIASNTDVIDVLDPNLILEGLVAIYKNYKNCEETDNK